MRYLTIIALSLALVASATAASAASLPEIMLGNWCTYGDSTDQPPGEGNFGKVEGNEWKECQAGDGYLIMRRTGYTAHETGCRFVNIKWTGRKSAPHTKSYPHEMVPIMRVTAQCESEGEKYRTVFEFEYHKGTLTIESKWSR